MNQIISMLLSITIAIIASGQISAQNNQRYDIIDFNLLKEKADAVAQDYLEAVPDFYGYTTILQIDEKGSLTSRIFPLDATFRYGLSNETGVDGFGIAITLDALLRPECQMGQFCKGKLPIKGKYMDLDHAIKIFMNEYPDYRKLWSVTLFHNASIDEPTYLFRIDEGLFIIGAISGSTCITEI